jgi:hypothetical protein
MVSGKIDATDWLSARGYTKWPDKAASIGQSLCFFMDFHERLAGMGTSLASDFHFQFSGDFYCFTIPYMSAE